MKTLFLWVAALLVWPVFAWAQDDTAHHRAVYKQINANQKSYRKVLATYEDSPLVFTLTGYLDGKDVRKIVAVSNEDGGGYEEFYLEKGKPLFVFSTYRQNHLSNRPIKVEDRRYFRDGRVFKWLTTDKSPSDPKIGNAESTKRLNGLCRAFVAAILAQAKAETESGKK